MKALITGASSGLGRDMACILAEKGYDIIAVARREDKLISLKNEIKTNVEIVCMDVTDINNCYRLVEFASEVDIFINNAGFGVFGEFTKNDLNSEIKMIDTNVKAMHILFKLFLDEFKKRGYGYILNVASLAAFFPGPLFGAYYATKAYVLRLTQAVQEELRRDKCTVNVSVLCPGPVHTEFGDVAKVSFGNGKEKGGKKIVLNSRAVSEYAIKKMLSGKKVIIPRTIMKVPVYLRHILSDKFLSKVVYFIQKKKCIQK